MKIQDTLLQLHDKCEQINTGYILRTLYGASEKAVNVEIAEDDLRFLKENNYKLCFAKKVEGTYTVVWQSYVKFLEDNRFSWTPQYQIFGTNTFKENVVVKASTKYRTIGLGEITTLDSFGIFSEPITGGAGQSINANNEYGPINLGVCQMSTGVDGKVVSTPIYVAPSNMTLGTAQLTPKEEVMVWFAQNIETSTMISNVSSYKTEIELTNYNERSVKFENSKWKVVIRN